MRFWRIVTSMKHTIGFNQQKATKIGLKNIKQALIFDLLIKLSVSEEIERIEDWFLVPKEMVCKELPILNLKKDSVYRYFKQLEGLGVIDYVKIGKRSYTSITEKGMKYNG